MTYDEVTAELLKFLDREDAFTAMMAEYTGGVVGGGPNGDGKYPLPNGKTGTKLVSCPAQNEYNSSLSRVERIALVTGQSTTIVLGPQHNGKILSILGVTSTQSVTVQLPGGEPAGWACTLIQEGTGGPRITVTMGTNAAGESGFLKSRGNIFRLADEGAVASVICTRRASNRSYMWLTGDIVQ